MSRPLIVQNFSAKLRWKPLVVLSIATFGAAATFVVAKRLDAQTPLPSDDNQRAARQPPGAELETRPDDKSANRQAELEAALVEMLSGATLEGSFTSTGEGRDPTKLSREKYTLGNVKKLGGKFWLIPARIQYGEHDVTLPITVPIEWAGDTPLVVVDNVPLPGFGAVSARVMFFADHYAGYWKHGDHGGHLFGVIRREEQPGAPAIAPSKSIKASIDQAPAGQKPKD